jgi:hypothetical protein
VANEVLRLHKKTYSTFRGFRSVCYKNTKSDGKSQCDFIRWVYFEDGCGGRTVTGPIPGSPRSSNVARCNGVNGKRPVRAADGGAGTGG